MLALGASMPQRIRLTGLLSSNRRVALRFGRSDLDLAISISAYSSGCCLPILFEHGYSNSRFPFLFCSSCLPVRLVDGENGNSPRRQMVPVRGVEEPCPWSATTPPETQIPCFPEETDQTDGVKKPDTALPGSLITVIIGLANFNAVPQQPLWLSRRMDGNP